MKERSAVVLVSGGIDSAACLALAGDAVDVIEPVFFRYGQQNEQTEEECATQVVRWARENARADVRALKTIEYGDVFGRFTHGLTADEAEQASTEGDLNEAYVPMRNLHFLTTGAAIGWDGGWDELWFGAQAGGDGMQINPDARPEFVESAEQAINNSFEKGREIDVKAPFAGSSKAEVVGTGVDLGAPFEHTWSCYRDSYPDPCGECSACVERKFAFEENGLEDPLVSDL